MAPTPERMILILTLSVLSLRQGIGEHFRRSLHVGLDDERRGPLLPSASCCCSDSRVTRPDFAPSERAFACSCRNSAICRAFAASASAWNASPGEGNPPRPSTSTGVDGGADFVERPRSSMSARTLPTIVPAMNVSPTCSVPSCTRMVATGPRPRSLGFENRSRRVTLESLQQQLAEGSKDLVLIIKADVQGSAEVLADTLSQLAPTRSRSRSSARASVPSTNPTSCSPRHPKPSSSASTCGPIAMPPISPPRERGHPQLLRHLHGDRRDQAGDGRPSGSDVQGDAARAPRKSARRSRCRSSARLPAAW